MKKTLLAALLLMVCAAPAFAWHRKPHRDPRMDVHPKAAHPKNENLKHTPKNKPVKHHAQ
jgi:hypothetical protein